MKYIQLLGLSTGYIEGAVPPQFSPKNIKPIDMPGSASRIKLDGRYSLDTCINKGFDVLQKRPTAMGFKIVSSANYREDGKTMYKYINEAKLKEAQNK